MSSQKRSRSDYETNGPPAHAPFAIYGTPLPAFDPEVRDDGSYVPVWKQEVTDERGRKRLHGAFTGGWSAGYFNTVGSKEGWTPATFVSSRNNRAAQTQAQRADDFMDEEDRAEQAESQQLEMQGSFAGLGESGNNASKGMFSDLFKTTGETMGVKLLQKMGWRQGQGIGAKVQRLAQGDKAGEGHMFAPENARIVTYKRKNDRKGIGFAGETSLSKPQDANDDDDGDSDVDARILSANRSKVLARPKKIKKSSFGVGVLNDTGSDDEDPYSIGPQINYNRVIGGNKKKKKAGISMIASTPKPAQPVVQKLTSRSSNNMGGFRKCHDGKLPIQGFVLSAKLVLPQENKHPPPEVPSDWHSIRRATTGKGSEYISAADAAKASTLDAEARAALLGESQLPGKSVFDFLTPAARDKLVAASGKTNLPQAGSEGRPADSTQTSAPRSMWDIIPRIDRATAAAALHRGSTGWMPYAEDLNKRDRYKAFLSLNAGLSKMTPQRPESFSTDEWMREMKEFVQAAEVFKPISGLMAARFTSSTSAPALASDQPDQQPAPQRVEDPAEEAAKIGMFGHLTRVRMLFHPTRLLCKRFGVKPPASSHVDPDAGAEHGGSAADTNKSDLVSQASIDRMMLHAKFSTSTPSHQQRNVDGGNGAHREHAQVDATHNEAIEGHRADEKTLKDIFET